MKPAKIIYFVNGSSPTPEDFEAANELNATVVFRNARAVPNEPHSLEECDGVTGNVPKLYEDAYPDAETAIEEHAAKLAEIAKRVGDSPAPKAPKAAKAAGKAAGDAQSKPQGQAPAKPGSAPAWTPNTPQE